MHTRPYRQTYRHVARQTDRRLEIDRFTNRQTAKWKDGRLMDSQTFFLLRILERKNYKTNKRYLFMF